MFILRKFLALSVLGFVCLLAFNLWAGKDTDRYPKSSVQSEEAIPELPVAESAHIKEDAITENPPTEKKSPTVDISLTSIGDTAPKWNPDLGPDSVLSLDDCVKLALERNVKLRAAGYDIEAAKGQLDEADALFWPVINYNYRMAPVPKNVDNALRDFFAGEVTFFNSIHVGLGIPIGTFGQLASAKRMAKGGVEAARVSEAKTRENTIYQIKQLYYGSLMAKEIIRMLEDAVSKISDKIAEEDAKEIKDIDPYDMLQLKLSKVDLEKRLEESKQNLELAYEGLRIQMDLEPGTAINLDSDNLKPLIVSLGEKQNYVDTAMKTQPESKLIDIGLGTKRLQYKLEKFKLMPKVGLGFMVEIGGTAGPVAGIVDTGAFTDPFNYKRAVVGLQFEGNLDFHGSYGKIKKAKAEYYKAALESMIGKRALSLDIQKAYLNTERARDDVGRARKSQSIARQMVFVNKLNVDMGIGDNQKYGDSLRLYLLMRGLYFKAVFDYNMAVADLAQRIGVAKFDEMMPVPDLEEYEAFDESADEGEFETYGIESARPETDGAQPQKPTKEGVNDASELNLE